ncbi:hypothetical protein [Halosolutus gelatinilyticus]|uniref:hypothetical protein n=1 Tax=Halosolutus gelatinilyticus TaxID=2931975 RepID=UPI001FF573A9|nr:hypothetical protein [Halosolutus gelatinilyticus]
MESATAIDSRWIRAAIGGVSGLVSVGIAKSTVASLPVRLAIIFVVTILASTAISYIVRSLVSS